MSSKMLDQFEIIKQKRQQEWKKSQDRRANGPIKLKEAREKIKEWDKKSRGVK